MRPAASGVDPLPIRVIAGDDFPFKAFVLQP